MGEEKTATRARGRITARRGGAVRRPGVGAMGGRLDTGARPRPELIITDLLPVKLQTAIDGRGRGREALGTPTPS